MTTQHKPNCDRPHAKSAVIFFSRSNMRISFGKKQNLGIGKTWNYKWNRTNAKGMTESQRRRWSYSGALASAIRPDAIINK